MFVNDGEDDSKSNADSNLFISQKIDRMCQNQDFQQNRYFSQLDEFL